MNGSGDTNNSARYNTPGNEIPRINKVCIVAFPNHKYHAVKESCSCTVAGYKWGQATIWDSHLWYLARREPGDDNTHGGLLVASHQHGYLIHERQSRNSTLKVVRYVKEHIKVAVAVLYREGCRWTAVVISEGVKGERRERE
jgi:hypothetical protein